MNNQSEKSMLHNVIWNYAKESETLKLEVENLKLQIGKDTINYEDEISELQLENTKLKEENKQLIYDFDSDEKNIHYKKLTEENTKLKLEVEKYDGTIKYIKELEGDNESLINQFQDKLHHSQKCSYCICKVCGFDKSKSKGRRKYCSMCLDPAAQQDWLKEPMNFQ